MDKAQTQEAVTALMAEARENKYSPSQLLSRVYDISPDGIKAFLDCRAREVLGIELPKMHYVIDSGFTMEKDADDFETIEDIFEASVATLSNEKGFTASIQEAGVQLARVLDKAVRVQLLEDTTINREAYMDLIAGHAKILRAIVGITELPPTQEGDNEQSD